MAVVVSHAMRRFPTTPPDAVYSYGLRPDGSQKPPWSLSSSSTSTSISSSAEGESALSRSMRYADPWLYGSVRAPGGLLLAPALVLCSCTDYLNGTKRSNKKTPTICKKCKGTRLPLSGNNDTTKFGTVRCYPTSTTAQPLRAGTVRVSSSTRPSILPTSDPYDLMRRSRLSVSSLDSTSQFRGRSLSPNKNKSNETRSYSSSRQKNGQIESYKLHPSPLPPPSSSSSSSLSGRRSILECDINPYELIASESKTNKDSSVTLLNGQRIRIRPKDNNVSINSEYEDVDGKKYQYQHRIKEDQQKSNEKESECNRFKSILKKRATTFSDTDTNSREQSPSPAQRSGSSYFYLPMPAANTPRKKVQFLVENEKEIVETFTTSHWSEEQQQQQQQQQRQEDIIEEEHEQQEGEEQQQYGMEMFSNNADRNDAIQEHEEETVRNDNVSVENGIKDEKIDKIAEKIEMKICKLRRSISERSTVHGQNRVVFHDTMALRSRTPRNNLKTTFSVKDLERLDGLISRTRKKSPTSARPQQPPPPPPPPSLETPQKETIEEETWKKIAEERQQLNNATTDNDKNHITENIEVNSLKCTHFDNEQPIKFISRTESLKTMNLRIKIDPNREEMIDDTPPSAPPRKRSNNKQPPINIVKSSSPTPSSPTPILIQTLSSASSSCPLPKLDICSSVAINNKTVVQISAPQPAAVHKLQIKNEFADNTTNIQTISVFENPQRKTSIMITGDDCYSTVNVNDDVPLYQSSVVVKDTGNDTNQNNRRTSSSVYITGDFNTLEKRNETNNDCERVEEIKDDCGKYYEEFDTKQENKIEQVKSCNEDNDEKIYEVYDFKMKDNTILDSFNEDNIPSSDLLKQLLKNPVEAVKRNLVPHVCGKSDVPRRQRKKKSNTNATTEENSPSLAIEGINHMNLEESLMKLCNYETIGDDINSENSSSTQYELMDASSECYTDHSNRSSVTEEELTNRTKFYELLADSAIVEVSENDDHHYESIKVNPDPIYEEIEIPPPLPTNPPPSSLLDDLHLDKEYTTRSIFEGASKYDILSYLVDAKERGIVQEDYNTETTTIAEEDTKESYNRVSHMSTVSDSSEDNSLVNTLIDDKATFQKAAEVERNDSGVGSETSKSSLSKYRIKQEPSIICEDCEIVIDNPVENEPLICRKCSKKRSERKEIITEIVETEEKYSRDLQIILEEFYQPMLVAGLLTPEQLSAIFLNVEELLDNSQSLAEKLRDAVEIALEQGDEDLLTVNIGKLFLEAAPMLHGFETYCIRQGAASLLLASLEKEKELLRIFLKVSQMENTLLRRMNLNSFLMVPVQRVTKYPLLLARLYKVTPSHHETREQLKEAQHKIELHLNHMNSETKDVPSKLWRRIGSSSGRRSSTEMDLVNIKLRKLAVDVLEWNHEEAKFALEGRLLFTQPTDNNWRKGRTIKLTPVNALLVINGKISTTRPERNEDHCLIFSRHSPVREAALLLVRDKNGRYSLLREPLYLDRCVIAADPAWQSYFEVQEILGKDTFIFKAEDEQQTKIWYTQLQFHAQGMGAWRKRRNALANIMINGMGLRS